MNYTEDIDDFSDSIFSEDPLDEIEDEQTNEDDNKQLSLFNVKDYSNKKDGRKQNSFEKAILSRLSGLTNELTLVDARVIDNDGYLWTIPAKVTNDKLILLINKVKQKFATFNVKTDITGNANSFDDCYINIKFIK